MAEVKSEIEVIVEAEVAVKSDETREFYSREDLVSRIDEAKIAADEASTRAREVWISTPIELRAFVNNSEVMQAATTMWECVVDRQRDLTTHDSGTRISVDK